LQAYGGTWLRYNSGPTTMHHAKQDALEAIVSYRTTPTWTRSRTGSMCWTKCERGKSPPFFW